MNRIALGALVLGIVLVACGGDDSNHHVDPPMDAPTSHAVCGDGILDVASETCDDGNTTSGDGCSSTCQIETVNKCGNGQLDGAETCDDGNTAGGDGCSAQCTVETGYMCTGTPSVCTMMTAALGTCANPMAVTLTMSGTTYSGTGTGDTTNTTDQVPAGMCDMETSSGGATDQIWSFTNPVAGPVLITIHSATTNFDAVVRLTTTVCDVSTQVPDDLLAADQTSGTSDGCADLHGASTDERLNYNNLPAGTYYIVIDGYSAGDDGPYTFGIQAGHGTCGNGVIEFGETCDDHNTANGDGCDDTCHVTAGYSCTGTPSVCTLLCGNGVLDAGETCDDHNATANDGCSATCQIEAGYVCTGTPSVCHIPVCGDGIVDSTEACDDHNHVPNDGCDASCHVETGYTCTGSPSACLFGGTCAQPFQLTLTASGAGYAGTGTSDTTNSTDQVPAAACDMETSAGAAHDQIWMFTNPIAQPVLITIQGGQTSFDAVLRLTTTACDVATEVHDDVLPDDTSGTSDGCADLHGSGTNERLNYTMLPAGTYYVDIDGYSASSMGQYTFNVQAGNTAVCGNGVLEGAEECDSSGVANARCTADCHLVFDTTDTENNDDAAHAQVITPVHHVIEGSLPVGDLDVYTFTLTAPSVVEIETYTSFSTHFVPASFGGSVSSLGVECHGADTQVRVFPGTADPTDDTAYTYFDDDDGDSLCSYLGPLDSNGDATEGTLAAGTYYFTVHEYQSNNVIPRYLVDFKVTPQ